MAHDDDVLCAEALQWWVHATSLNAAICLPGA